MRLGTSIRSLHINRVMALARSFASAHWAQLGGHPMLRESARTLALAAAACASLRGVCSSPHVADAASSFAAPATAAAAAASGTIASVPVQRLQQAITPQVCQHLCEHGYAVVDNVLGEPTAAALRGEIAALRRGAAMHKNHTHLVQGGRTGLLEKEHVHEAELMLAETQALAPLAAQLQHDSTLRVMLSVLLPELSLHSQAIKLQWNAGRGGCFPMHFDASLDTRRVTTIWYLNPSWKPGDGGELRLYPFPQPAVDIAPLNDRMVLFSSQHMLHRVLPSAAERYCFTIWISEGGGTQRHAGSPTSSSSLGSSAAVDKERAELRRALSSDKTLGFEEAWRLALHPELRKHAAKWVYRQEWERSIRESHPAGPALDEALATFRREVGVVGRALAPLLPALEAAPSGLPRVAWF